MSRCCGRTRRRRARRRIPCPAARRSSITTSFLPSPSTSPTASAGWRSRPRCRAGRRSLAVDPEAARAEPAEAELRQAVGAEQDPDRAVVEASARVGERRRDEQVARAVAADVAGLRGRRTPVLPLGVGERRALPSAATACPSAVDAPARLRRRRRRDVDRAPSGRPSVGDVERARVGGVVSLSLWSAFGAAIARSTRPSPLRSPAAALERAGAVVLGRRSPGFWPPWSAKPSAPSEFGVGRRRCRSGRRRCSCCAMSPTPGWRAVLRTSERPSPLTSGLAPTLRRAGRAAWRHRCGSRRCRGRRARPGSVATFAAGRAASEDHEHGAALGVRRRRRLSGRELPSHVFAPMIASPSPSPLTSAAATDRPRRPSELTCTRGGPAILKPGARTAAGVLSVARSMAVPPVGAAHDHVGGALDRLRSRGRGESCPVVVAARERRPAAQGARRRSCPGRSATLGPSRSPALERPVIVKPPRSRSAPCVPTVRRDRAPARTRPWSRHDSAAPPPWLSAAAQPTTTSARPSPFMSGASATSSRVRRRQAGDREALAGAERTDGGMGRVGLAVDHVRAPPRSR